MSKRSTSEECNDLGKRIKIENQNLEWWKKKPIYQIYPKSFKDSNHDGIGDIKGILSRVDYLVSLGIGSVWINPIYPSPQVDNEYDISDYVGIDPVFGTMQDFKDLAACLHQHDIKLIMDFVPNHTSDQHVWFQKSVLREDPYTDYYIWRPGTSDCPPNNWKSVFGGSAWEFHPERQEWYLHQFYKQQPDLNARNLKVVTEWEKILIFWIENGVDGFRMDSVAHLFESLDFADEQEIEGKSDYESVDHSKTYNLPEVLDLLKKFRHLLEAKGSKLMITEAYLPLQDLVSYYGNSKTGLISHMPLNLVFVDALASKSDATAQNISTVISSYLNAIRSKEGKAFWPNFHLGNHDKSRLATRVGPDLVDAFNALIMLLPGTPITYYGEELGMEDIEDIADPTDARDKARTPMQWDSSENSGFTSPEDSPWLPVNKNFTRVNVKLQEESEISHLKIYRNLAKLRTEQAILCGDFNIITKESILFFTRTAPGEENSSYLCGINFGNDQMSADIRDELRLPEKGELIIKSNIDVSEMSKQIEFSQISLLPKEAIVAAFR